MSAVGSTLSPLHKFISIHLCTALWSGFRVRVDKHLRFDPVCPKQAWSAFFWLFVTMLSLSLTFKMLTEACRLGDGSLFTVSLSVTWSNYVARSTCNCAKWFPLSIRLSHCSLIDFILFGNGLINLLGVMLAHTWILQTCKVSQLLLS